MLCLIQLEAAADDAYITDQCTELAGFSVELSTSRSQIKTRCFVTLTSPLLRRDSVSDDAVSEGLILSVPRAYSECRGNMIARNLDIQ